MHDLKTLDERHDYRIGHRMHRAILPITFLPLGYQLALLCVCVCFKHALLTISTTISNWQLFCLIMYRQLSTFFSIINVINANFIIPSSNLVEMNMCIEPLQLISWITSNVCMFTHIKSCRWMMHNDVTAINGFERVANKIDYKVLLYWTNLKRRDFTHKFVNLPNRPIEWHRD